MVAGGLPISNENHAIKIATVAIRMQQELKRFNEETDHSLEIRIGIHTGPVVAGVIGFKKFSYDIWGDTVNVASRMESHGIGGEIQISKQMRDVIRSHFKVEERGYIDVKGKGQVRTYLLRSLRAPEKFARNLKVTLSREGVTLFVRIECPMSNKEFPRMK